MPNRLSLLALGLVLASMPSARANDQSASASLGVERVSLVVRDLAKARALYRNALGFEQTSELSLGGGPLETLFALPGVSYRAAFLRLGEQRIVLVRPSLTGRELATDTRSDDQSFQHLALVVRDIDRAYARLLRHRVAPISHGGPQTIPASNPAAGGIRAFYFRDLDRHPLELIWFPSGKGDPRWQRPSGRLVLGIDHTAIAVRDSARSEAFYREVAGLTVRGRSFNTGPEQEALSGVPGARVRITGLRGSSGPGVELLEYVAPRDGVDRPDSAANDLWSSEVQLSVASLDSALAAARQYGVQTSAAVELAGARCARVLDPDGHALRLVER